MCYRVQSLSTLMEIMRMKPNTAITHQNKLAAYLLQDDTFCTSLPSPPPSFWSHPQRHIEMTLRR